MGLAKQNLRFVRSYAIIIISIIIIIIIIWNIWSPPSPSEAPGSKGLSLSALAKRALSPNGYLVFFLPAVMGHVWTVQFWNVCFPGGPGLERFTPLGIMHYEYIALAKRNSDSREAMLLSVEAFEVRIARCCKQRQQRAPQEWSKEKAAERTILYYSTLHYTTLYYTMLYYNILYYTILYYTITYNIILL